MNRQKCIQVLDSLETNLKKVNDLLPTQNNILQLMLVSTHLNEIESQVKQMETPDDIVDRKDQLLQETKQTNQNITQKIKDIINGK